VELEKQMNGMKTQNIQSDGAAKAARAWDLPRGGKQFINRTCWWCGQRWVEMELEEGGYVDRTEYITVFF
jgi:hypothetical protein